mmetsp:Transcript_22035/g.24498  ORF Transcript_22035/g.24498 Transcript_22035/m.24498 type:complete len:202 (-) Transcript_22035:29-634(-)
MGISSSKLSSFGAKNPYNIRYNYQLYRWVIPIFLHANFMHIFFNTVALFWIGFNVERNPISFFALYILSGIGGFIFSSLIDDSIAVGASGAIFGIIGVLITNLVFNWRAIYNSGAFVPALVSIVMLIMMAFMGGDNTDTYGHLGGLFFGLCLSIVMFKYKPEASGMRKLSLAGWVALFFYVTVTTVMIGLFFTVKTPEPKV